MKITKIELTNFMKFSRWKSGKLGKINIITGTNEVGKSTILTAITEGLTKGGIPIQHITIGEEKSHVAIEIDGRYLVESTATTKGSYRKVTDNEKPVASPQAFLDKLLGRMGSLNPIDFLMAKKAERRDLLFAALPITLPPDAIQKVIPDNIPAEYLENVMGPIGRLDKSVHPLEFLEKAGKVVYDVRSAVNRELDKKRKTAETMAETLPQIDFGEFEGFDADERMQALQRANLRIADHKGIGDEIDRTHEKIRAYELHIAELEQQIAAGKKEMKRLEAQIVTLHAEYESFIRPDVEAIQNEISRFNACQRALAQKEQLDTARAEIGALSDESEALTAFYKGISDLPKRLLESAKLPIEGLEIKGDDILVGAIPFDDLSTGRKIIVCLDIAKALAGPLKVICIDRFESLGKAMRDGFAEIANQDEWEYFVTLTTPEGELNLKTEGV